MRILAMADLHADYEILDRLGVLPMRREKYDLYLLAGDIAEDDTLFLEKLLSLISPVLAVPGNRDTEKVVQLMEMKGISIHKKSTVFNGLKISGFGFSSPTPFDTPGELPEDEIFRQLETIPVDQETLFLAHTPPYGILDKVDGVNAGSKSMLEMIREKQPFLYICGHIHEQTGHKQVGNTTVINLPPAISHRAALLEIDPKNRILTNVEFVNL